MNSDDTRSLEIYRTIMRWLQRGAYGDRTITIPVRSLDLGPANEPGAVAPVLKDLHFRKVDGLGGASYAESVEAPEIRIYFDPNWEDIPKIESLLKPAPGANRGPE